MAGKLTARGVESLAKRKGRFLDGDGLFLRVLDPGRRVYWVYRYRLNGKDRETSVGSYPAMTLADARTKHKLLVAEVAKKIDPVGDRRAAKAEQAAKTAEASGSMTFGECADGYVERQEKHGLLGKNPKHRRQWRSTLASLPASFRDLPVGEIGPQQVFDALNPIWAQKPETASRLRGRIAAVLDDARGPDDVRPNAAAWSGWLKKKLGDPRKLGKIDGRTGERVQRGNHPAMPYADVAAFVKRLRASGNIAALALEFVVLTATRANETLGMQWREVDFDKATWVVPEGRMKIGEAHSVPLSDRAIEILAEARQRALKEPEPDSFVFFGTRPKKPLSHMAMSMILRRMKIDATVHGFRTSFRTWASDEAHAEFEIAEQCLSHRVGSAVSRAYNRTSMLERRRPLMEMWARYVAGEADDNVVPIRRARP